MYFVYLIECKDGTIYTGITTDVKRRMAEHRAGKGGAYTRSHGVRRFLYSELKRTKSLALKREIEIKRLTRGQKIGLVKKKFL